MLWGRKTPMMQAGLRTAIWMWLSWWMPEPSNAGSPSVKQVANGEAPNATFAPVTPNNGIPVRGNS